MTTGAASHADTGAPLTMECPLPCAVLACSKARGGTGAGRDTHQATYDVYYHSHRSPGRPTNDESNHPEALGGAVEPRYPPALWATSGTNMPKSGPILTLNPFIWMSSGALTPSTD